jgi:hypothetical protein
MGKVEDVVFIEALVDVFVDIAQCWQSTRELRGFFLPFRIVHGPFVTTVLETSHARGELAAQIPLDAPGQTTLRDSCSTLYPSMP